MLKKYPKTGELVIPGEKLSPLEVFMPGENVYVEDGFIYAAKIGNVLQDLKKRKVWVYSRTDKPALLKPGEIVLGQVTQIKDKSLTVKIFAKLKPKKTLFKTPFTGEIYIANAKREFLETMSQAFTVGDIIKCKVSKVTGYLIALDTKDPDLGIVYSRCTKCYIPLKAVTIKRKQILQCPKCKIIYPNKKVARDYGKIILH